jgi:2,3-bisphosphoglycerate-independent phosphoglycerate mutase
LSSMLSKGFILIQDGLGDLPITKFGGITPLEAAATPAMDRVAAEGIAGKMRILNFRGEAGTDIGHLAWFGQDPKAPKFRRGPIEAAGVGLELRRDDVALRFNFATIDPHGRICDRRAGRIRNGTAELVDTLNQLFSGEAEFYSGTEHRGVLLLRGKGLSSSITDSDPGPGGSRVLSVESSSISSDAGHTATLLNRILRKTQESLEDHPVNRERVSAGLSPANAILTRSAGRREVFTEFYSQRGIRAVVISGEATVLGMGSLAGLEVLTDPELTANLDTDLEKKAQLTLDCLSDYDLIFLHLKGCDIAGHEGDADKKKSFIEETDRVLGRLLGKLKRATDSLMVGLVADHSTPCEVREHTAHSFPVAMSFPGVEVDVVQSYGESECEKGQLGEIDCSDFVDRVVKCLARPPSKSFGQ